MPRRSAGHPFGRFLARLSLGTIHWFSDMLRFSIYMLIFFAVMLVISYQVVSNYIKGNEVLAPDVTGKPLVEAMEQLREGGSRLSLLLADRPQPHELVPEGSIISQYPPAGVRIKSGTPLSVVVSGGLALVTVPEDLKGQNKVTAGIRLRNLGLKVGNFATLQRPDIEPGTILQTDPPGGTGVPQGSSVNLLVAAGEASGPQRMPDLMGISHQQAAEVLGEMGIVLAEAVAEPAGGAAPGAVHRQFPSPDDPVTAATRVTIAYAPEQVEDMRYEEELPAISLEPLETGEGTAAPAVQETPRPRLPELIR